MKNHFSRFFACNLLLMSGLALQLTAAPSEMLDESVVRLSGHVPSKAVSESTYLSRADGNSHVSLTFVLPLRNRDALEELVKRIYDPNDQEYYGKYLTPEEFAEQFAPTEEDYDHVVHYARSLGLHVMGTHSNRTLMNVSGRSDLIEKAFNIQLHHYQKSCGRTFYAPDKDPEVPSFIANKIHGIVGLDNHAARRCYIRQKHAEEKSLATNAASQAHPSGPGGGYSPKDILTAYNLNGVQANGANQVIALFELGKYQVSDINVYTQHFGLPAANLKNILVDGGASGGIDPEVTLDIELALALAPQSQIYVYEGPNSDQGVLDTYNRIATDNIAKQVSTSWGMGEDGVSAQYFQAENAIFQQMAAQGQTIYAAAGDSGAYDDSSSQSLVVDDPGSQPYVVAVGGTRLTVDPSSGAYSNEVVWNDGAGQGAGGGGVSAYWPLPAWQKSVSTLYSKTHRNVPDVALNADPETGYSIFYNGQWTTYGGTSCAAPLWAAFTACINQVRSASQKPVLGFANPLLYAIGVGSSYAADFHDVTSGNNLFYSAGKGYDNATGWGTFNGANLFASLTNSLPQQLSPVLNVAMKHNAPFQKGGMGTYKIVVSNQGNGATSGNVTVNIALPNGLTCSSLSGSGWTVDKTTLTCTQSAAVSAGSRYPTLTLIVNVDPNAPKTVIPSVTVSGGGAASSQTATNLTTVR